MKPWLIALAVSVCMGVPAISESNDLHDRRERESRDQPLLLKKGDDYSVHLVRGGALRHGGEHVISHTSHKSGKMKWLYCSGVIDNPTRRITYTYKKICGIHLDAERLYVAEARSGRMITDNSDRPPYRRHELKKYLNGRGAHFSLFVFSLRSGDLLKHHQFIADHPSGSELFLASSKNYKGIIPGDHLGNGPFERTDEKLYCFGHQIVVDKNNEIEIIQPKLQDPEQPPEREK
jgi:hypothetical protein